MFIRRVNQTVLSQLPRTCDWAEKANFPISKKDLQLTSRNGNSNEYPNVRLTNNALEEVFERLTSDGVVCIHNVAQATQNLVANKVNRKAMRMIQRALQFRTTMWTAHHLVNQYPNLLKQDDHLTLKPTIYMRKKISTSSPHCDYNRPTLRSFSYPLINGELFFVDTIECKPDELISESSVTYPKKYVHLPRFIPEGQDNYEFPVIIFADGALICHGTRKIDSSRRRYLQTIELQETFVRNHEGGIANVPRTTVSNFIHSVGFPQGCFESFSVSYT
ncbi:MAG: hypothetical protein A3B68_02555 [Candidatus Melainabacteria bacterium RIFCSPHIGHO2_02_FULL_34_12]|nr:MAG: hypothetical protein A3B68_02555 [Candidatus Melainabacteria bacterium RIFCSPHIGHO2_02_FULL_34_12]